VIYKVGPSLQASFFVKLDINCYYLLDTCLVSYINMITLIIVHGNIDQTLVNTRSAEF